MVKPFAEFNDHDAGEIVPSAHRIRRRLAGGSVWLASRDCERKEAAIPSSFQKPRYQVHENEEAIGLAMLREIEMAAGAKDGDLVIVIVGGRGGQALHRLLGEMARTGEADCLLKRLHLFTQDALAPLRMENGLSFTRDFERLFGEAFFGKIGSFTPIETDTGDLEGELTRYVEKLDSLGGIDIFFLGHGPEPDGASHLAYIRPGSGATFSDVAGVIPISSSILDHHISKFKAGGSAISEQDETECRLATSILTLGPAAILGARRVVQSVVDVRTAPAKRETYRRVLEAEIADDPLAREAQFDENPGLWIRLHPNAVSLILPDVLAA